MYEHVLKMISKHSDEKWFYEHDLINDIFIINLDSIDQVRLGGKYYKPRFRIENGRLVIELEEVKQ